MQGSEENARPRRVYFTIHELCSFSSNRDTATAEFLSEGTDEVVFTTILENKE